MTSRSAVGAATLVVALFRHASNVARQRADDDRDLLLRICSTRVGISDAFPLFNMNAYRHDDAGIEEYVRYAQELLDRHEHTLDLDKYNVELEDDFSADELEEI